MVCLSLLQCSGCSWDLFVRLQPPAPRALATTGAALQMGSQERRLDPEQCRAALSLHTKHMQHAAKVPHRRSYRWRSEGTGHPVTLVDCQNRTTWKIIKSAKCVKTGVDLMASCFWMDRWISRMQMPWIHLPSLGVADLSATKSWAVQWMFVQMCMFLSRATLAP